MTPLERLKAIIEARTKGPWVAGNDLQERNSMGSDSIIQGVDYERIAGCCCCGGFSRGEDARFIALMGSIAKELFEVVSDAQDVLDDYDKYIADGNDVHAIETGRIWNLMGSMRELKIALGAKVLPSGEIEDKLEET